VFPARYELNSYIVFRKRLASKRLKSILAFIVSALKWHFAVRFPDQNAVNIIHFYHREFKHLYTYFFSSSDAPAIWFQLLHFLLFDIQSCGSSVGIATGYGLDDRGIGVRVQVGPRIIIPSYRPNFLWGQLNVL
jgi:hypothetical protein